MSTYVLRGGSDGTRRLRILAEVSWPATERFLTRVGIRKGWRCLDVGCGIGHVAIKLAGIVGKAGRSVGADFDTEALAVARDDAAQAGAEVEFREGAISDLEVSDEYDLVYARFLLSHLGDPADGLAHLISAAKPGGVVVVEDVDFASCFSWPPSTAVDRYAELYRDTAERLGADPLIGPKLVGMFLDAGLRDVSFEAIQPLFHEGDGKLMPQVTMEHIRERVVASGLADDGEIDGIVEELDRLRREPRSLMGHPRIFQVWGYRAKD